MKRGILILALFVVFGAGTLGFAAGMILVEDSSWWPGPVPPRPLPPPWPNRQPYRFAPLQVESVKVLSRILDQIAVTSVEQEFYNPNSARLEGTFVFPVPKGAHLDKFTMEIDGRKIEAELLSAEKARHIYEDIVRKLRDPALLEYAGMDVFKARIFPIEPNARKRITLSYTQLLPSDSGLVGYVLPLSMEKFSCQPVKNLSVKVELETQRPLKSVYSPSHILEVKRNGSNRAVVGFEAAELRPEADFALYFAAEKDELGINLLTHRTLGDAGYFLLLASPGLDIKEQKTLAKDVAFVLDTSGSMAGKKLEQAKKALEFCVENLNEGDRFELIRFSTEVEPLFDKLVEASRSNRQRAEDFVEHLKAMGATAIDDALRKALELQPGRAQEETAGPEHREPRRGSERPFAIIFLTDGRPTIGLTDEEQILANVKRVDHGRTRIFSFGIGTDVNTHLLDKIAEATRGFSQYVLPEEDIEIKVSGFFSKIKEPVVANPVLKFAGDVRVSKLYPTTLPDLFKGQQLVLVGRYEGQGEAAAVLEGEVNGGNRRFAYDVKFPAECPGNDFIPRLWATRRVGYLLEEIRLHGENSELRDEVTELARHYGIVTPYTAYLIVEDEQKRDVPVQMRSMPELQRDRGAREEAARGWRQFTTDQGGDSGVASSLSSSALKSADAAAPAALGAEATFARRYGFRGLSAANGMSGQPEAQRTSPVKNSEQAQFVGGKSFFRNGTQWIDSGVQKMSNARRARIQFGSEDYFELLAKHPEMAPWLAVGPELEFVWQGIIYEIYQ